MNGSNFILQKWRAEDAADLPEAFNNLRIHANLRDGIPYPYTAADGEQYIRSCLEAPRDSQYCWAIAPEGKAVGSIGIFRGQNIHRRTGELGYWLAEPYWGRGIVTAAVREACRRVFADTDLLRVFAEPFSTNAASCRVLEKAGFQFEGTLRSHAVKDGVVLDMKLYALVKE